jgi:hypothetical protein
MYLPQGGGGGDCILGEGVRLESRPGKNFEIFNERRYCMLHVTKLTVRQLSKCRLYRSKVKVVSKAAAAKIVDASRAAPIQGG